MKQLIRISTLPVLLATLVCMAGATSTQAANDRALPMDRLENLEQRIDQIAERQEQLMRRIGAAMDRRPEMGPAAENPHVPRLTPAAAPHGPTPIRPDGRLAKSIQDTLGLLFLIGIICNVLLAIWIATDIRKRGEGSGIFVALALVAGIPSAIIYCLARIGDRKP